MNNQTWDVVVLGGGLAGLTCALQLRKTCPRASVLVLEREPFPVPEAAHKVGESTVEVAAHYFRDVLGLREHLTTCQLRKLGLRVFFPNGDNSDIEQRLEVGSNRYFPAGTSQIDRGRFENFLSQRCREEGVAVLDSVKVKDADISEERGRHFVRFERRAGAVSEVSARWVIDASGRAAILKRKLGLAKDSGHHANAAWFRLGSKVNIDDWGKDAAWRDGHQGEKSRWFSTNHLLGEGYWVWLIPLASGSTSIGIVADPRFHPLSEFNTFERALAWLRKWEPQCARAVQACRGTLQDFIARKHYSHKCTQVFSENRWGLTGDAGIFIDPLYSPGSDFIALANTYLCEMIEADLQGKPFAARALVYNDLFLSFSENTFLLFEGQYELFGNAPVMSAKIFWDYATYWSFLAFLFLQGRISDVRLLGAVKERLVELSVMNREMQRFFRRWHRAGCLEWGRDLIDVTETSYLYELNRGLTLIRSEEEIVPALESNLVTLKSVAGEIVRRAGEMTRSLRGGKGEAIPISDSRILEDYWKVFESGKGRTPSERTNLKAEGAVNQHGQLVYS